METTNELRHQFITRLPTKLYRRLKARSKRTDEHMNAIAVRALEVELGMHDDGDGDAPKD